MDGLSLYAVKQELLPLIGGKVDKIQQPERDALLLTIRAPGSTQKLLLCAHPENGRVQLTEEPYANPQEPPNFCMLLRRRLSGGRIISIEQLALDRVLTLTFDARDELGDSVELRLIVELMGRHSNISFVSGDDTLLDCIRHVSAAMSSVRILLPGVQYRMPPTQEKQNPLTAEEAAFFEALSGRGAVTKLLIAAFLGLSPDSARQILLKWAGETELMAEQLTEAERHSFARYLHGLFQSFLREGFTPTVVFDATREPLRYYPFTPALPHVKQYGSMSSALDEYYRGRDRAERFRRRSASLHKILQNNLERCLKKLAVYEQALNQDEDLERLRLYGELLTGNMHALERGKTSALLLNYYKDPPAEELVPLDERLSPQENAQRYFKRYQKGKSARALATEQCARTRAEIDYLEGQLDNLGKCDTDVELIEIREELIREGYVRPEAKKKGAHKHAPSKPLHLKSSDGYDIYVGRNNQQNDALTLRFANSEDFWFHTKNIPGSHVILRDPGDSPPERAVREAAMLAAYYSKARASASVPVDYCLRKYVKKPGGAKPGMVIYTTNRTLYVTPDEAAVKGLEVLG